MDVAAPACCGCESRWELEPNDRNLRARECGYEVRMVVMHPPSSTPKNDVIVGWRTGPAEGGGMGASESESGVESSTEWLAPAELSPEQATGWA